MKSIVPILAVFLMMVVTSTHAQINPITVVNTGIRVAKLVDKVVKGVILFACHITDLKHESVRNAFNSIIFNYNNPNVTRCVAGCAVVGFYTIEKSFRGITGIDVLGLVPKVVGDDMYKVMQDCVAENVEAKCSFFISFGTCAVPRAIPIIQRDLAKILEKLTSLIRSVIMSAIRGISGALGNVVPGSKPIFQEIEEIMDILFDLSPFSSQPALGDVNGAHRSNLIESFQKIMDIILHGPKNVTSANKQIQNGSTQSPVKNVVLTTLSQIISSTTVPTTTTTVPTTTKKPDVNTLPPVLNFFANILRPFQG